jgi:ribosomal protein S18 acetylase RimI-like enzyme
MLPVKFRNSFRYKWLQNFFKKQRGDLLLVAYKNMKIFGFILILKKKFGLQIDLIVTSKKYQKRKVGTSLINYTIKNYLMKNQVIRAGTQVDNFQANSLYKKLGFKKINKVQYIYHVHSA